MNPDLPVMVRTIPDREGAAWPHAWPLPRMGDKVAYPDGPDYWVRVVEWYPEGEGLDDPAPFVVVVLAALPEFGSALL